MQHNTEQLEDNLLNLRRTQMITLLRCDLETLYCLFG